MPQARIIWIDSKHVFCRVEMKCFNITNVDKLEQLSTGKLFVTWLEWIKIKWDLFMWHHEFNKISFPCLRSYRKEWDFYYHSHKFSVISINSNHGNEQVQDGESNTGTMVLQQMPLDYFIWCYILKTCKSYLSSSYFVITRCRHHEGY
jgi:hypothetical protein